VKVKSSQAKLVNAHKLTWLDDNDDEKEKGEESRLIDFSNL
jgi:hypothetical protein